MTDDNSIHVLYVARGRQRAEILSSLQKVMAELALIASRAGLPTIEWNLVTNQKAALRLARSKPPRVVLVELKAQGDRLEFCNVVHQRWPTAKLVAIDAEDSPANVRFDATLPANPDPGRIQRVIMDLLRNVNGHLLTLGPIRLDLDTRTVITPKGQYHMTPKQCALLRMLMERRNEVVSRSDIMQCIWETNFMEDTRTLDVHIRWLRERIELDPSSPTYLVTVRGRGYRFSVE
ncbi:MAG: winged helix-turn-helix domain-containing protein [Caldilineaceae bacterium]|nr:winged helix-turn-helix domain-containing protein [Caldilineaceae bacterium]